MMSKEEVRLKKYRLRGKSTLVTAKLLEAPLDVNICSLTALTFNMEKVLLCATFSAT